MLTTYRRHSVLIIDDSSEVRYFLRDLLTEHGFEAFEVPTIGCARDLLSVRNVDAIMLGMYFPGTSGLDYLTELRAAHRTRRVPVLLLSSLPDLEEIMRGISLGANDFIPKPIVTDLFLAKLEVHLRYFDVLARLERNSELLSRVGAFDTLTQVYNQNWLPNLLTIEVERAALRNSPLAVAIIEFDVVIGGSSVVDKLAARDEILPVMARRLEDVLRESDVLTRFRDDEFCAILPSLQFEGAGTVAERIRQSIESKPLSLTCGTGYPALTVGVAWVAGGEQGGAKRVLENAMAALDDARLSTSRRIKIRHFSIPKPGSAPEKPTGN